MGTDWLSLLPAIVAIVLAFLTRQVLVALFCGIATGGVVLWIQTGEVTSLNLIDRFLFPAIGSENFALILLIYLWCLGGLVGIWERTGGARVFAEWLGGRVAKGPRSSLVFAWLVGVLFHQGGTVSTVLAGFTVRPTADRHRIAHEELAYVVDSTASPVATILPFNAWPLYTAGLVAGTIPLIPDADAGVDFFLDSIRYNFYGLFAVASTLLFSLHLLPWIGRRMRAARERARTTGALDGPDARPLTVNTAEALPKEAKEYRSGLADFLVPIGTLLGVAILPYAYGKLSGGEANFYIKEAFALSLLSAVALATLKGMPLGTILGGFVKGCQGMTIGALVLALAVTLGTVSKELNTADFLIRAIGDHVTVTMLPGLLLALCMAIAFSTGTAWGTYAVVFPVALPLAYAINPDPTFVQVCFGAVLGGAVFGDQCSPISDTTILASMFTGCDVMDHVKTQLPLALAAAGAGAVVSTAIVAA